MVSTPQGAAGPVDGVAVSRNFFLVRVVVTETTTGPCAPGQFQGSASIVPAARDVLILTASGVDSQCNHEVVSGRFSR